MDCVTVVDLETTGLCADRGDRIIEIGAIKLRDNKIVGVFNTLVNPNRKIPTLAQEITGISPDMVKDSPSIDYVLKKFIDFAGDDTLVMHNAKFDGSFIRYELKHLKIEKEFEYYCTLINSRKILKSSNYKLATLKNLLKLNTFGNMHRALCDTYVTAQLYLKLKKMFGIDTTNTLERDMDRLTSQLTSEDFFILDN